MEAWEHRSEPPVLQPGEPSVEGRGTSKVPADAPSAYTGRMVLDHWHTCKFYLGLLTTALVLLAWTTNLVAKPMATIFGGSVTLLGMGIAFFTYRRKQHHGHVPVPITHVEEHLLPGSILAVLMADKTHNEAVIRSAIDNAHGKTVTFLYPGLATPYKAPRLFEFHDPYYDDQQQETRSVWLNTWHGRRRSLADSFTDCKSRKLLSASGRSFIRAMSSFRLKMPHFQNKDPQRLEVAERQGATRIVNVEQESLVQFISRIPQKSQ